MQFIENSFADKVRKNKIKSPLREDFSIENWNKAIKITEFDKNLYEAGLYFHSQLNCIRDHLKQINTVPTSLSHKDYLKFFVGISNRNTKVSLENLKKIMKEKESTVLDINFHAIQSANNPLGNLYTLNEISTLSVDGIFYNVLSHLKEISIKSESKTSQKDIFEIIHSENLLSQLYFSYEQYWNSILYEQITFKINNNQVYLNDNPEIMISSVINENRNSKLRSNHIILNHKEYKEEIKDIAYLVYNNNKISISAFSELDSDHQLNIVHCLTSFYLDETINFIPNTLPNFNFNLDEVISVFCQLSSLSYGVIRNLSSDTAIEPNTCNKIKSFNKAFNIKKLSKILALSIGIDESKTIQIIEFLTFTSKPSSGPRTDLWRSPIVKINEDQCIFVLEPLLHPVGLRCFEGWMAKANVDISQKGAPFEKYIKNQIKELLEKNNYIDESHFFERDTISIDGEKEEIDLLFKIGNLIILGEAKCIVTTDSAKSIWNTLEIIKHASEQALRKINFVSKNFKKICSSLDWDYDENLDYNFNPIVLISNGFGVGNSFFGVPIIDHTILFSYFKKDRISLISTESGEDLTYAKLYSSSDELQKNFSYYTFKPPAIEVYKICVKYLEPLQLISCKDNYKKLIQQTRLGISEINEKDLLEHNYGFELVQLESLDSYLADV